MGALISTTDKPSIISVKTSQQLAEAKADYLTLQIQFAINYIINRRKELENKVNYKTYREITNMYLDLQNRIEKAIEYIKIYRSYQKIDNKDYLKGRDEIGCLDIYQVDELLDILKEVSE